MTTVGSLLKLNVSSKTRSETSSTKILNIFAVGYANSLREASALTTPTLIAIIVTCTLFLISAGLLLVFCRCRRAQHGKKAQQAKDLEMDSVRPTIIPANGNGQQVIFVILNYLVARFCVCSPAFLANVCVRLNKMFLC